MPTRLAALCLAVSALSSGCAAFNQTVRHELTWQPAVYAEVSRERTEVALRYQTIDGELWVTATEKWECIEEATQQGVEFEERKPSDVVLGVGAVLGGLATSAGIGLVGGALTSGLVNDARNGQQNPAAQIVGTGIGIVGTFGQLLLAKKIIEGLNTIRFERTRPVHQELGRKVPCEDAVLFKARVVSD